MRRDSSRVALVAEAVVAAGAEGAGAALRVHGQHVGVFVMTPRGRGVGGAEDDLEAVRAQRGDGAVEPVEIQPARFGFHARPREFADADPGDAGGGHAGGVFGRPCGSGQCSGSSRRRVCVSWEVRGLVVTTARGGVRAVGIVADPVRGKGRQRTARCSFAPCSRGQDEGLARGRVVRDMGLGQAHGGGGDEEGGDRSSSPKAGQVVCAPGRRRRRLPDLRG